MPTSRASPEYLAQDSSAELIAVGIAFAILNTFFVILRVVSQQVHSRPFSLSDLFSYISFVFVIAECGIGLEYADLNSSNIAMPNVAGVGRHIEYVANFEPEKLVNTLKIKYALSVLYISAFTFPKLSILFLYLQVFSPSIRTKFITYILIGAVLATWVGETLTSVFQCIPVTFVWDHTLQGHCVARIKMFQYYSIPNIITDVALMILPIPKIWTLKMTKVQKMALTFTFLLGSIGLISAIIRFVIFGKNDALNDGTWSSVPLQQWVIIEVSINSGGSASKGSTWASSKRGSIPRTTRLYSNDVIEGHNDDINLMDYGQRANGEEVEGIPAMKNESREVHGITKTQQVTISHEAV
ncbi:integral membrane protein [Rutstroemia sp. NJR-2017a BBW]|nr:integral membrane protein [Rutstroemia sp. NJR-2017a BBW]